MEPPSLSMLAIWGEHLCHVDLCSTFGCLVSRYAGSRGAEGGLVHQTRLPPMPGRAWLRSIRCLYPSDWME